MAHYFDVHNRDYANDISDLIEILTRWEDASSQYSSQLKDLESMSLTRISDFVERYFGPSEQYSSWNHYITELGAFRCELDMDFLAVMLKELYVDVCGPALRKQENQGAAEKEEGRESASRNMMLVHDDLKEFTCFRQLPLELQQLIWKFALPGPRVIDLHEHPGRWFDISRPIHQRFYALACVCRTSNEVLNANYSKIKVYEHLSWHSVLYVDPVQDIFLLPSVKYPISQQTYQSFSSDWVQFVGSVSPWFEQNFRNVATYCETLSKALRVVRRPPGLPPATTTSPLLTGLTRWKKIERLIIVNKDKSDITYKRFLEARQNRNVGMSLLTAPDPVPFLDGPIQYSPHTFVAGITNTIASKFRQEAASHKITARLRYLKLSIVDVPDVPDDIPTHASHIVLKKILNRYYKELKFPTPTSTVPPSVITHMPLGYSFAKRINLPGGRFEDAHEEDELRRHFCYCKSAGRFKDVASAPQQDYKGKGKATDNGEDGTGTIGLPIRSSTVADQASEYTISKESPDDLDMHHIHMNNGIVQQKGSSANPAAPPPEDEDEDEDEDEFDDLSDDDLFDDLLDPM